MPPYKLLDASFAPYKLLGASFAPYKLLDASFAPLQTFGRKLCPLQTFGRKHCAPTWLIEHTVILDDSDIQSGGLYGTDGGDGSFGTSNRGDDGNFVD